MLQLILVSGLFAQYDPYIPAEARPSLDPRLRRAAREACVARTGIVCRPLVEHHGDSAVAALNACSPEMGRKLAQFYSDGRLAKLPGPNDFLLTVSKRQHGDIVADWGIKHAEELADADAFRAFLAEPLEYVLELKALSTGATESRAHRLAVPPAQPTAEVRQVTSDWRNVALLACVLLFAGFLVFYNRRRQQQQPQP